MKIKKLTAESAEGAEIKREKRGKKRNLSILCTHRG
jgi:hypothetical protein